MYEAVSARPAGPSTVARLAATAADCGYAGLVILNPPEAAPQYDGPAIESAYGIDVVQGVSLAPTTAAEATGGIGHHRLSTTVLALAGGATGLNDYGVRQEKVDVLTQPMSSGGDVDHVTVQTAANHDVRLAIDLGPVLRGRGDDRTQAIRRLRKLRELIIDADAPYVVTAGATSHLELRAPRELAAVASVAGFDPSMVTNGLGEWRRLAERNRLRQSDSYVAPGVRRRGEVQDE